MSCTECINDATAGRVARGPCGVDGRIALRYLASTILRTVLFGLLVVPLACNRGAAGGLVGTWHQLNGPDAITFRDDGSFNATMVGGFSGSTHFDLSGTYFIGGDKLSLTYKNGTESMTCTVKIEGREMTITYDQGASVKLDRRMARFRRS